MGPNSKAARARYEREKHPFRGRNKRGGGRRGRGGRGGAGVDSRQSARTASSGQSGELSRDQTVKRQVDTSGPATARHGGEPAPQVPTILVQGGLSIPEAHLVLLEDVLFNVPENAVSAEPTERSHPASANDPASLNASLSHAAAESPSPQTIKVDQEMLGHLTINMGFSRNAAESALRHSGNLNEAIDFLLASAEESLSAIAEAPKPCEPDQHKRLEEIVANLHARGFGAHSTIQELVDCADDPTDVDAIELAALARLYSLSPPASSKLDAESEQVLAEELDVLRSIFGDSCVSREATGAVRICSEIHGGGGAAVVARFIGEYPGVSPLISVDLVDTPSDIFTPAVREELHSQVAAEVLANCEAPVLFLAIAKVKELIAELLDPSTASEKADPIVAPSRSKAPPKLSREERIREQNRRRHNLHAERALRQTNDEHIRAQQREAQLRQILKREAAAAAAAEAEQGQDGTGGPGAERLSSVSDDLMRASESGGPGQSAAGQSNASELTSLRDVRKARQKRDEKPVSPSSPPPPKPFQPSALLEQVMADVIASENQPEEPAVDFVAALKEEKPLTGREEELGRSMLSEFLELGKVPEYQRMLAQRRRLPAYQMRGELVKICSENQIVVVSGATGCGKTTQIPQVLEEALVRAGRGARINMICTQPRRISAIGVADRIAEERVEPTGQSVGYAIRLEKCASRKTRMLFCTTGVLLRRLQHDPTLSGVSHLFVDEIHERDLNTDFLLIVLRTKVIPHNPHIRIVLMSATLNAELFSEYFGGCPVIEIPGRAYPVTNVYLERVLDMTGYSPEQGSDYLFDAGGNSSKKQSGRGKSQRGRGGRPAESQDAAGPAQENVLSIAELRRMYPDSKPSTLETLRILAHDKVNYDLIERLVDKICAQDNHSGDASDDGAILIFLPGLSEIQALLHKLLGGACRDTSRFVVVPLHSTLDTASQKLVFQRPPPGARKIVLSTNIAETSITIDDCTVVIDTGRVKENRFDPARKMATLQETWVSRASGKQREGRAGRVRPGRCFSLYTSRRPLQEFTLPEMLRVPLESLALSIKILDLGDVAAFLAKAVNPPGPKSVEHALGVLDNLQALDTGRGHEHLTSLGFLLAKLPVDPRIGKMLIFGSLFQCLDPLLTIAAGMSLSSPLFSAPLEKRDDADKAKREFCGSELSDHILFLRVFEGWQSARRAKRERQFIRDNFLSYSGVHALGQTRRQFRDHLSAIGFACSRHVNANGDNLGLVRAILCASLFPNVAYCSPDRGKEVKITTKQGTADVHPASVNHDRLNGTGFLVYLEKVQTSKIYIRDSSVVGGLPLLVFGSHVVFDTFAKALVLDDWLRFKCDKRTANLVLALREEIQDLLFERIEAPKELSQRACVVTAAIAELLM